MNKKTILELIKNEVRESNTLEFKRADTLYNVLSKGDKEITELTKDITAMANSNGGTVIYGIQEYAKGNNKGKAERISPIEKNRVSVEWLEQILNSRIQPRIEDIIISEIEINENEFIIAVDLKQSSTVHQANDKKYYKRFNFQSVAMDDWEVKSLINRFNRPILEENIYIKKKPDYLIKALNKTRLYEYDLVVSVSNKGNIMVKYLSCFLRINKDAFVYINFSKLEKTSYQDYFELEFNNKVVRKIPFKNKEVEVSADYEPILPNSWRILKSIPLSEKFFKERIKLEFFISTESTSLEREFFSDELEIH